MSDSDPEGSICSADALGSSDQAMDHVQDVMKRFRQGQHSDFIIKCGDDEYPVHKAIICARSSFFDKACSSGFKEAAEGIIDLKEDDPLAVRAMVDFFYLDNYLKGMQEFFCQLNHARCSFEEPSDGSDNEGPDDQREDQVETDDACAPALETLHLHAKVYVLADKYDIKGLQKVATDNFERFCKSEKNCVMTKDFKEAIKLIYNSTQPKTLIRRAIIDCMVRENECLGNQDMLSLIFDTPELATELMKYFSTGNITKIPEFKAKCVRCRSSFKGGMLFNETLSRWGSSLSCANCNSRTWELIPPSERQVDDDGYDWSPFAIPNFGYDGEI